MLTRRTFLSLSGAALAEPPADLRTPFKFPRLVVTGSNRPGTFDRNSVDCPFVFRHEGRFYMTYVGFDGEGYQTGWAVSSNLTEWKPLGLLIGRDPNSPVTRYNVALTWILRDNDVFGAGTLKRVGGRFLGVYHAYPKPGYEEGPAVIGLCWSRDLRRWELDPPCLRAEDGAAWEQGGLYKACLVEHAGAYYLFYNAKTRGQPWREQTGFATSKDLKRWVRFPGNPVIPNGGPGAPDEIFASDPCVLRHRDRWALFYYGLDKRGVARDLLALAPAFEGPVTKAGVLIDVGPKGSIDSRYAHKPSVIAHQGALYHFYCAVSEEFGRGIGVARSRPF
jgi:predicted GH43/DUF377 family glycosyl hydrolase